MDIKKFISCDNFNNNYNELIQKELSSINKGVSSEYECLYKVSDYEFFNLTVDMDDIINDPNIKEFAKLFNESECLCYSGPMIKRYMNPIKTDIPIDNYYNVSVIDTKTDPINMLKDSKLAENIELINNTYIIKTSNTTFYLNKKSNLILSNTVLKLENPLDRIVLGHNNIWVSGMFILELYKKISCYNSTLVDPLFKYPEDILNIYDRHKRDNKNIKYLIDTVDIEKIKVFDKNIIESTLIQYNDQRYNVLEYILIKIMSTKHPVINYHLKTIITHLSCYNYNRPIFFVAKFIGFDKKYPALYESLLEIPHYIDIEHTVNTKSLESLYHIDMFIINHLIKNDNDDIFIKYITKMNIKNKFKQSSKTSLKICIWLMENKAYKIINSMLESKLLCDTLKYKIIFLTGEFNLLGRDFIDRYLSNSNIDNKKKNNRIKITKKEDIIDGDSISIDSISEEDNTTINKELREIILTNLDDIVKKGLTRSFYIILKLCPDILQSDFYEDGNILHIINSDISIDILEIVLKINPELKNQQNKNGLTPINMYAKHGLTQCITMLLQYDTDYTITDNNNNTFIHALCRYGHHNTLQSIIRNVIDIIDYKNDKLMTPLLVASKNGYEEIVYILKGLDADMNAIDVYGNTVYHYICNESICLGIFVSNNPNKFGFTPKDYCKLNHSFYHFQ